MGIRLTLLSLENGAGLTTTWLLAVHTSWFDARREMFEAAPMINAAEVKKETMRKGRKFDEVSKTLSRIRLYRSIAFPSFLLSNTCSQKKRNKNKKNSQSNHHKQGNTESSNTTIEK